MRLETEFRLCAVRQRLAWLLPTLLPAPALDLAPSTWVKLVQPIAAGCSDEALLLCQSADSQWIAWVPEYGETTLDAAQIEGLA